jgi:hypothetical protein
MGTGRASEDCELRSTVIGNLEKSSSSLHPVLHGSNRQLCVGQELLLTQNSPRRNCSLIAGAMGCPKRVLNCLPMEGGSQEVGAARPVLSLAE